MDNVDVYTDDELATMEEGFSLIESLPDELATEDKTVERLDWMIDNTDDSELQSALIAEKQKLTNEVPVIAAFSAWKCAKGIATAIAQNAVPIAKVLKIKKRLKLPVVQLNLLTSLFSRMITIQELESLVAE
ncbi:hypothetical protein AAAC51_07375 [Priestia megaterium]